MKEKTSLILVEVRGTSNYLHNGFAYLAGATKERVNLEIIDLNYLFWSDNQLLEYLEKSNPAIIGFSIKSSNVEKINYLIKEIKKRTSSLIIVGGAHVTLLGVDYLKTIPEINYGFLGEAEGSINAFFDYLENKKPIETVPGLIYQKNDKYFANPYSFNCHLDELDFPSYASFKDLNQIFYFQKNSYPLLTSRGCPYKCIYCSVKYMSGNVWRVRSIRNIIEELNSAKEKYQINSFEIVDDNFTIDINRAIQFCQELIKENINLSWSCPNGIRADRVNEKLARNMYAADCRAVSIGIESGDEKVFNNIKKGETLDDIIKAIKILMANKIKVTGFFIVGLPYDNLSKTKKTIRFIEKLKLKGVKWNFLVPYPKTELSEWISFHGKVLADFSQSKHFSKDGTLLKPTFETPDFTAKERIRAWKIANLATGSYSYVFKIPKNILLYKLKIFLYLLYYLPVLLINKIVKKLLRF